MIIRKLTLHNFGLYAGTTEFVFTGKKPVVLIGGLNGRGKTTFLEAVLLALYGQNSFAYAESKSRSYSSYLKKYCNKLDKTYNSFIELEFLLENDNSSFDVIRIIRGWNGNNKEVRENITVFKNGAYDQFLTKNWLMYIESILPSGISQFFFFDGEKIAEIATEKTNKQMKDAIKSLLGISVIESLEKDVRKIVDKYTSYKEDNADNKEYELLKKRKEEADQALSDLDSKINSLEEVLEEKLRTVEKLKADYAAKGGDAVTQRRDMILEINTLKAEMDLQKDQLINIASGALPLNLVYNLLEQVNVRADREKQAKLISSASNILSSLFAGFRMANPESDLESIDKFLKYVDKENKTSNKDSIYNISDQAGFQLDNLLEAELLGEKQSATNLILDFNDKAARIDTIESYLNVEIDEKELDKIYRNIRKKEQEIIDIEVQLDAERNRRSTVNGTAIHCNTEFNRFVESLLSKLEMNDDSDRVIKYAHQIFAIAKEYKLRLQGRKVGKLAETMTECYKRLASKKSLIHHIDMDAATLDLTYLDEFNNEVPRSSLSAGEKQLMVISLLWALAICSNRKLPVIIDTPLSRLDSNHRTAIIANYFPNASDQTIILSTDTEIDEKYYEMMKKDISDEYTLVYHERLKYTTIKKGYAIGEFE